MSIVIDVPQQLESELFVKAGQTGQTLQEYVLNLLRSSVTSPQKPKTGAELVEYWKDEGVIGTRPEISDSQSYAHQLREEAEAVRRRSYVS